MVAMTMNETSIIAAPNFLERAFQRLCSELSADAEDWNMAVNGLRRFQDTELLDDPSEGKLKAHQQTLEMLIAFGELVFNATKSPAFPNRETHRMVDATLQILRDDLAIWHGNKLTPEKSAQILAACFPA